MTILINPVEPFLTCYVIKCYFDNELFEIELKKTTKNKKK